MGTGIGVLAGVGYVEVAEPSNFICFDGFIMGAADLET